MHKIFVRCCICNKLLLKKYAKVYCEYVPTSPCDGEYFISPACKKCAKDEVSIAALQTLIEDILAAAETGGDFPAIDGWKHREEWENEMPDM